MPIPTARERVKTKEYPSPWNQVLSQIDAMVENLTTLRDEIAHHISSPPDVTEWAGRICATIENESLTDKARRQIVESVPPPLRHAVAAECYRTNENITFGWVATIASVFTWEVPDLLRAHGVEPEFTADMSITAKEVDEEIAALEAQGVLKR